MPLNFKDPAHVNSVLHDVQNVVDDGFCGAVYSNAYERYKLRRDAFYQKHSSRLPRWRSNLFLPSFFNTVQAAKAQFFASHSTDTFVYIDPIGQKITQEQKDKALAAQMSLKQDIYLTNYKTQLEKIYWYTCLFGTGIGREYVRIPQEIEKMAIRDSMGMIQESEQIVRKQFTVTDVIHPLNFTHAVTKSDFGDSSWSACRFQMPTSTLYQMRGNPIYYQPGVKRLIDQVEKTEYRGWSDDKSHYYSERGVYGNEGNRNEVIVYEYVGTLNTQYNRGDVKRYYVLYSKEFNIVLRVSDTPFVNGNLWKMQPIPDPDGPYGVGIADSVLPLNYLENDTVNQYIDYKNVVMKYMYHVSPEDIVGGYDTILNGLPNGIVPVEESATKDPVRPVRFDQGGSAPFQNMMELVGQYKQENSVMSNLRSDGTQSQSFDTATGISLVAEREDQMMQMLQKGCDSGIERSMRIKLQNMIDYFPNPQIVDMGDEFVEFYPRELRGVEYQFRVDRRRDDIEASKQMAYYNLLQGLDQYFLAKGVDVGSGEVLMNAARSVGRAMGVYKSEEDFDRMEQAIKNPPAPPVMGAGGAPEVPQALEGEQIVPGAAGV